MADIQVTQAEMAYISSLTQHQSSASNNTQQGEEVEDVAESMNPLTLAQRMGVIASDEAEFSSPQQMIAFANQRLRDELQKELQRGMGSYKNGEAINAFQEMNGVTDPEQTASFIVSQAVSFFGNYLDNHSDESFEDNLEGFRTLISGAIDKGFSQARNFLGDAVNVFDGIEEMLEETREQIDHKLDQFMEVQMRDQQTPTNEPVVDE
ncbi:DUF5610 domain-containing protein [Magnetococcus sp. PR-3]|uniref:DUF5610 domain-containing protein n=1 Tax=Magnetococcus sp. PR-3 TaxID=3120355 RepID=UPI002FCE4384